MYVGEAGQPAACAGSVSKEECRTGDADEGEFSTDLTGARQKSELESWQAALTLRDPNHEGCGVGDEMEMGCDPKHEDYSFGDEIALCRRMGLGMGMPFQSEVGSTGRHALKLQSSEHPPDRILEWLKKIESCPTESLLIALEHIAALKGGEGQVRVMSQFLRLSTFQESDRTAAASFFKKLNVALRE
ncbi:hypothetical protein PAQ31011_02173 [Pandoraea aquatica]|uniref:Uncharacterized protein n=1 Tax=Pandoraea aquatica TaxID=2508290 RepID=A0A5E4URK4_9BURK|nr:hypothetical protein [Pandoraea aquatica]VVE01629.1 hypothetical protein PAQ31011_02173 [Pandoraea aquatica]